MKQEDIELLLKDLCARLPYKVYAQIPDDDEGYISAIESVDIDGFVTDFEGVQMEVENVKPYLFPLSSMTEEQKEKLCILCDWHDNKNDAKSILVLYQGQFVMNTNVIDWFNKNHFDYRGLIQKGLALDATGLNIY